MANPFTELDALNVQLGLTNDPVPVPRPRTGAPDLGPEGPQPPPVQYPLTPQPPLTAPPSDLFGQIDTLLRGGGGATPPAGFEGVDRLLSGPNAGPPAGQTGDGTGGREGASSRPAGPLSGPLYEAPLADQSALDVLLGGVGRGFNLMQRGLPQLGVQLGTMTPAEAAAEVAKQQADVETYPYAEDVVRGALEYERAEGVGGKLAALFRNPKFVLNVVGESLGQTVPSVGLGAVGLLGGPLGVAAGVGAGSGLVEYSASVFQTLVDKGVDLSNAEQVETAFRNPEWMKEARSHAIKRGVPVGVFDGLTSLVAPGVSRAVTAAGRGGFGARVAGRGAGLATEAVGGAGGEAAAGLVADGRIDMGDVLLEAVGEVVAGGPEFAISSLARDRSSGQQGRGTGRTPTQTEVDAAFGGQELGPEVLTSFEDAQAEGRTLYGFDEFEATRLEVVELRSPEVLDVAGVPSVITTSGQTIPVAMVEQTTVEGGRAVATLLPQNEVRLTTDIAAVETQAAQRGVRRGRIIAVRPEQAEESPTGPVFRGSTRALGVRPPEIQYANLRASPTTPIAPGDVLQLERHGRAQGVLDIDLNKLRAGDLVPTPAALLRVTDAIGQERVRELAERGGSAPEAIANLLEFLREGVAFGSRADTTGSLLRDLETGALVLQPDARWMLDDVRVGATSEAAARVETAKVVAPTGALGGPIGVATTLRFHAANLRREGKRGEVVFDGISDVDLDAAVPITPEQKQELEAFMATAQAIMDKLGLTTELHVLPTWRTMDMSQLTTVGFDMATSTALGTYLSRGATQDSVMRPGVATITLNLDLLTEFNRSLYQTAAHEFGHFLMAAGLTDMQPTHRARIFAAYRRFLATTKIEGATAGPLGRAAGPERNITIFDPNYQFSFEEWFADQVSRAALTRRASVGLIAKYVKPLARRLLRSMQAFAEFDPTNAMRAEPEIENWLASVLDQSVRVDYAGALQDLHNQETRLKNEHDTRGVDIGRLSPMSDQSILMRDALDKLGVESVETFAQQSGIALPPLGRVMAQVDKFNWFYKWFLSLPQVAERNLHIQPLQGYREVVEAAHVEQSTIMSAAHDRVTQWRALGTKQAEALGQLLFDVNQMNYLSGVEREAGVVRHPSRSEFQTLVEKYGLDQRAVGLYGGIRQDFERALGRHITELLKAASQIAEPAVQQRRVQEIERMHRQLLKRPYFPLTRYGRWTLTVRTDNEMLEHFETFETKSELQRAARRAREEWPQGSGFTVQMGTLSEMSRGMFGIPPQMLDMIADRLELGVGQRAELDMLKFELSPAQSFKKRFLRRSEVPGWSDDAQRNYANYMFHHAKHHTRVKYAQVLRDQIRLVRSLKEGRGLDATKLSEIGNFMDHHMEEFLNPKADLASLRSLAAVWYLGFVPQSALLNLTQLGLATAPFLSAKFGDLKALNAMRRATLSLKTMYSKAKLEKMPEAELQALGEAMSEGFINESQAAELAALSEGNTLIGMAPGREISRRWAKTSEYAMYMFQGVEQYNRRVTFRAAWQLAMENPNSPWLKELAGKHALSFNRLRNRGWNEREALAYLAGKDAVLGTQFEYARYARPRFMQGRKGAIFMFYMFTQNMAFMLWNNKGLMPRYLLTMAFIGGLMGIPGFEDAEEIIRAMAGRFGKDLDIEKEARKYIVELLGEGENAREAADLVLRGTARTGLGIPQMLDAAGVSGFPKFDMSRQIGMGRVLPFNPAFLIGTPGESFERATTEGVQNAAGAAFGIGFNLFKAVTDTMTPWNDVKRWERAMPRSAKNASRAIRFLREGKERDSTGAAVVKFDVYDPEHVAEAIVAGMGLQPTRLTRAWDRRIAEIEVDLFWNARRQMVMRNFAKATLDGDKSDREAAMRALRRFNDEVPFKERTIRPDQIRQSLRRRALDRVRREAELPRDRSKAGVTEYIQRLYPNAVAATPVRTPKSQEF